MPLEIKSFHSLEKFKKNLNPGSQKIIRPSSHRFHIEVLFKQSTTFSAIVYDLITNTLYHYENDKDDVCFCYSGGFLMLLLLSLMIMIEILNEFLRFENTVTFIISKLHFTWAFYFGKKCLRSLQLNYTKITQNLKEQIRRTKQNYVYISLFLSLGYPF